MDYEAWKAREADYKANKRKRRYKTTKGFSAYVWDRCDPVIRWESLIPRWQWSVTEYVKLLRSGVPAQEAWNQATPSIHSTWDKLVGDFLRCLERVAEEVPVDNKKG